MAYRKNEDSKMTELLTARELAEKLRCSERTIRAWAKAGMPSIKVSIGRLVRFDPQAVERWLQSQQKTSKEQEA